MQTLQTEPLTPVGCVFKSKGWWRFSGGQCRAPHIRATQENWHEASKPKKTIFIDELKTNQEASQQPFVTAITNLDPSETNKTFDRGFNFLVNWHRDNINQGQAQTLIIT